MKNGQIFVYQWKPNTNSDATDKTLQASALHRMIHDEYCDDHDDHDDDDDDDDNKGTKMGI